MNTPAPFKGEPLRLTMTGNGIPIWTGTGSAGGLSIYLFNKDPASAIYLGYTPQVAIGAPNTVELDAMTGANMDGSRTLYAIGAAGTGPLQVIPGGSNFFQQFSSLTIPLGATSGARIVLNGLTGTITGYTAANRVAYVITSTGIFMYQ